MFALVAFRTGGFEIAFREKPKNEDLLLHPEVFTEEEEEGSITVEDEQRIAIVVLLCSFDVMDKIVFFGSVQTITVVAISVNKIINRTRKVI